MSFLPTDYELPEKKSGDRYLNKFEEGQTKIRILTSPKVGHEWFIDPEGNVREGQIQKGDTPVRVVPKTPMKVSEFDNSKHFWAMPVWNYEKGCVQIWKATQFSIQKAIESLIADEDWGTPLDYDIVIKRKGTGFNDTEYSVIPKPKKDTPLEAINEMDELNIDMDAWMRSDDPFKPVDTSDQVAEEVAKILN